MSNNDWIGIFGSIHDVILAFVCQTNILFKSLIQDKACDTLIPNYVTRYSVRLQSKQLHPELQLEGNNLAEYEFYSYIRKVRII